MFEDYYDNPALQGLLAAGGPIMDTPRQAAVMPMTQQAAAPLSYDALADRRAAANAPPQGTFLSAPTDNLGKGTGYDIAGQGSNVFEYQGGPVRVTDRKGNVLFSGEGPEAAVDAARFAQNLSDTKGKNASWDIQQGERTINPDGSVGATRWVSGPSDAKEGMGTLGDLAAFVAPVAMAIATAGMSLPAQMALAAAAGGVGGVLSGRDPLKAAIISGATAGLGNVSGANAAIGKAIGGVGGTLLGKTAEELAKQAAAEASGQIVVTGLSKALQGAGSGVLQSLVSGASNNLGGLTGYKTPAQQYAQQPLPEAFRPPADMYAGVAPIDVLASRAYLSPEALAAVMAGGVLPAAMAGNVGAGSNVVEGVDQDTGEIVVEKYRPINPPGGFDPMAVAAATGLPIGSILESLGALNPPPADPALMQPEVTTPQAVTTIPPEGAIVPTLGPLVAPPSTPPTAPGNGGVLGTGLNIPQLLSIGGVGADLLKSLLAGGDGTGTGVPYTSPFGTGVGFARGQDMRVNPNILDYERYGFGPEAMFFRPEYSGLVSGAAPAQAPQAMTTNPMYQPLI